MAARVGPAALTFALDLKIIGSMVSMKRPETAFLAVAAAALAAWSAVACHSQKKVLCPCEDAPPVVAPKPDEASCIELLDLDEQVTLKGAVRKVIGLLKEENYTAIFEEIAFPQDVQDLKDEGYSMDEIVGVFAEKRAHILLQALESLVDTDPELSADGTTATFTLSGEPAELSPSRTITMVRLDGKWYLKN